MTIHWQDKFSARAAGLYGSMTRKLMHLLADPEVISFGGGLPAWELFPVDEVRAITDKLLSSDGPAVLQYNTSEGYEPLREAIAQRYRQRGFDITVDNVLIDTGSMQGIDLIGKLFLDQGDTIVVGEPTFLTALQAFTFYGARYLTVPLDDEGMQIERLPKLLARGDVKFIYIMPTFQNPSGRPLSLERHHRLVEIAAHYGVPIVEDNAYGELRYDGEALPALKALNSDGVMYLGSFSKVLSPGLRVGYIIAPKTMMEKLVYAKQAADLHTSILPQRIAHEFMVQELLDPHIQTIIAGYRQRRDAMLAALTCYFPPKIKWTRPSGGMFLWVELPSNLDTTELFERAVAAKVAYVPGANYFANGGGENTMRLNFSANRMEVIRQGIGRLASVITNS